MCTFADFNRPKVDVCTNLRRKHSSGEQNFVEVMELLNNVHNIREMEFVVLPQICIIIYPKSAHLLILTAN